MSAAERAMPEPLPQRTAAQILLTAIFFAYLFPPAFAVSLQSCGVTLKGNFWLILGGELYFPMFLALGIIFGTLRRNRCVSGMASLDAADSRAIFAGWLISLGGSLALLAPWKMALRALQWDFSARQGVLKIAENCPETVFWLLFFFVCAVIPVFEEIVFRRSLYSLWLPMGKFTAFIATAGFFSALHFFLLGAPSFFFFGIVLQILFLRTKNLSVAIAVHSLFNATAMLSTHF